MGRGPMRPSQPIPRVKDQVQDRTNDSLFRTVSELVDRAREPTGTVHGARFLGRQVITASGFYRPTPGTTRVQLTIIGGGGGGGSASQSPGVGAGGGGSSGVMLEVTLGTGDRELKGGPVVIGNGGTGGVVGAVGTGGAGGQSSIVIDGVRYTANGGAGGTNCPAISTDNVTARTVPTLGDDVRGATRSYSIGSSGIVLGGAVWVSGDGGSTRLGAGGMGMGGTIAGSRGLGYGSGGGGAAAQTAGRSGGLGAPGACIIDEYGG